MTEKDFRRRLNTELPDVPPEFHDAMTRTLDRIVAEDAQRRALEALTPRRAVRGTRCALVIALAAVLLLAGVAIAAYRWNVFDSIWRFSASPQNIDSLMTRPLHTETVNNVEITIDEAGYDGRTLYLMYSYRMLDIDYSLMDDGELGHLADEEAARLLYDHGVGWWTDCLWVNGVEMSASPGSGSQMTVTHNPGELVQHEYWRLDNADVTLEGKVEISLPIGKRPEKLPTMRENPERFTEDGALLLPDEGVVTFTLDVGDTLSRVHTEHPNRKAVTPDVTMSVSEISFAPLMTYITLNLECNPASLEAYRAEHGEGYYDEDGTLLWPYDGSDLYGIWVSEMRLVDRDGNDLFPSEHGCDGYGAEVAWFLWPHMEEIPDELYLAPMENGVIDMSRAVSCREAK